MASWTPFLRPSGQRAGAGHRWRWSLVLAAVVGVAAALRLAPVDAPSLPPAVNPIFRVLSVQRTPDPTSAIPYLGVNYLAVSRDDPAAAQAGLLVASVDSGSPAAAAGIQPGDLIIGLNGNPVRRSDSLVELLRNLPPNSSITLNLQRGPDVWDTDVRLGIAHGR